MRNVKFKTVILLLIVTIVFSILTLSSCNRSYDKEEVIAAAKILLKDAEMLNIVYYGSGIKYFESEDDKGYYCKADTDHLEKLGFSTLEELKKITEKTFSDGYSSVLYSTILSSLMDDTSLISPARYYQVYDEETGLPTHIMVYSKFDIMFKDSVVYDYDSIQVDGSKKEKVYVTVDATVTNSEGKTQTVTIRITLVEEEDGWKIDAPTFANYNEYKDLYDELNNKDLI